MDEKERLFQRLVIWLTMISFTVNGLGDLLQLITLVKPR